MTCKPKLRFKEFTDKWEKKKLGKISEFCRNGLSLTQNSGREGL
ncbi:MAG: conserved hypothetical protein [Methanobrevibacter sp. CfCl-M3]